MLPIENRLKQKKDFDIVRKRGHLVPGKMFSFVFFERGDKELSRFGFIVSTKISKRAVIRNRVRRLLRESVQTDLQQLKPGYDCVFLAKTGLVGIRHDEVLKEVEEMLKKTGII